MAQGPDRRYMTRSQAEAAQIDVGLRNYMLRVYNYMALGVAYTGAIALLVASSPAAVQALSGPIIWVLFIGVLGMGFFAPRLIATKSVGVAQACFWGHATLWALLLGPVLFMYAQMNPMLVPKAFFITAGAFAGMSLLGYTTKKDLSGFAAFAMMAMIGLLIAIVVNIFLASEMLSFIISAAAVLLFAGMTAWETQQIKNRYSAGDMGDVAAKKAIFGAFELYTTFVVMFIHVLNILGIMNE